MSEQQPYVLKLSVDEVVLLENLLQDYKDRLRHEAQLELDLTENREAAQSYLDQASVISDLHQKVHEVERA